MSAYIARQVNKGELLGAVVLVARQGRIGYFEAFGCRDSEAGMVMDRDAIFRIASMTKPFTSLAAMMLVERGQLFLGTPLSHHLPEFTNPVVGMPGPDGSVDRLPALREATIFDLLRHTAGFTSGWFGAAPVKQMYNRAGIGWNENTSAQFRARLAALPLESQPGSTWTYSDSTDVQGEVIEAVSGIALDAFIKDNITGTVGMVDTGFWVDPTRRHRLAEAQIDPLTGARPYRPSVTKPPPRAMGGSGMVPAAMVYARFCQFWLNLGKPGDVRLVSRKTVEKMTANLLPPGIAFDSNAAALFGPRLPAPTCGMGFSLGFSVRTSAGGAPWHGSVGAYDWMGVTGRVFLIDPAEGLLAVLMTQAPAQLVPNMYLIRAPVYQAIHD
ncbi:MAG: serine hydrolase domain-containing protein [Cypionkella sp.]